MLSGRVFVPVAANEDGLREVRMAEQLANGHMLFPWGKTVPRETFA